MTQDQIILLLAFKDSRVRGAASMICGQRIPVAEELVKLNLIEKYGPYDGYRITDRGLKWLEKNKRKS